MNLTMRIDLEQIMEDVKVGPDPQLALEKVIQHIEAVSSNYTSNFTADNRITCYDEYNTILRIVG